MRILWWVAMVGLLGCSKRGAPIYFQVQPTTAEQCTNTLVQRARMLGYVESMADHRNGFFSVGARTSLGGKHFTGATSRNAKRNRAASQVHFNVQCQNSAVSVVAVGVDGPLDDDQKMNGKLRKELDRFGAGLRNGGTSMTPAQYTAPPPAAEGPRCNAEQLPEWQTSSPEERQDLIDWCRGAQ